MKSEVEYYFFCEKTKKYLRIAADLANILYRQCPLTQILHAT